ncbi:hypothetical protein J4Q44_G00123950 [Coregonus suidteri]|uniref:Uncharacterized protein n=1 Tax=Coregonus suidteri TaxID=861788 RepID=A0AAN8LQU2_9TELE
MNGWRGFPEGEKSPSTPMKRTRHHEASDSDPSYCLDDTDGFINNNRQDWHRSSPGVRTLSSAQLLHYFPVGTGWGHSAVSQLEVARDLAECCGHMEDWSGLDLHTCVSEAAMSSSLYSQQMRHID